MCLGIFQGSRPTGFIRCLLGRCSICPSRSIAHPLHPGLCQEADWCKLQGHTDSLLVSGWCQLMESSEEGETGLGDCARAPAPGPLKAGRVSQLMVSAFVSFLRPWVVVTASCPCLSDPRQQGHGHSWFKEPPSWLLYTCHSFVNSPFKTVYYTDSAIWFWPGPRECLRSRWP